jgi:hypothetical protein
MALVIKTGIDPQTLVSQVRAAVQSIDPEQPIADVRTMDQWISRSLQTRKAPMTLLGLFGAVARSFSRQSVFMACSPSASHNGCANSASARRSAQTAGRSSRWSCRTVCGPPALAWR